MIKYFVLKENSEEKVYIEEKDVESYLNEDVEVFEEEVDDDNEELLEFKADGEDSQIADPKGNQTPKRRADKRNPEKKPAKPGSGLEYGGQTKAQMMGNVMKSMKSMSGNDLANAYQKMVNAIKVPQQTEDIDSNEDAFIENYKITSEDINISEDATAMFGDEELSEEFKEKATNIFEAAVVAKVNAIVEEIVQEQEAEISIAEEKIKEQLEEKLNDYLDYSVQEWLKENKLAIDSGIKNEVSENLIIGLKTLFDENYISVPEESEDLIEELVSKNEQLEKDLSEEIDKNVDLTSALKESVKEKLVIEVSEDLNDLQFEKLSSLSEGLEFVDEEQFVNSLNELKEAYFPESDNKNNDVIIDDLNEQNEIDTGDELDENANLDPSMKAYVTNISKQVKSA